MSLEETRLDLAVRVTERALRASPAASVDVRLDAFRTVYAAVAALDAGTAERTCETIQTAWALVEDAFPRGGPVDDVLTALAAAHRVVAEVAFRPTPSTPSRPRRDA